MGHAILAGAPVETTLRWPRTSVELQDGAAGARPASERPALASPGTASSDAQLSGRSGSASGGSAARGGCFARPAIGGLGGCGERASSSLCAASAHSGCGPLCGSRSESETLRPFIRSHAETEFGLVKVAGFELYSSVLAAGGATHRVEMRQEF